MTDTRQALAALLPCPFCGNSKGLAVANENPQDLSGGYFIACPSCDASTGLRFACGEDPIPLLIEQWNRRAALSAQPVAGAGATDETGWLIEHSGEILPGAEQRAQVSWLRVQMKFNGYGAREFGFTHDANEALRFARKEDAEAVLAMHLGARPPDWYSNPFSVTEHMWPAAPQAQAAPAPEPSAQAVAHPSHQTVREWMPVSEALRLSDLWTAGDLDNCGQWRAAIKVLADEVRALAASPQPEPSAQGEPVATVTEEMVTAYLTANDAYWKRVDGEPTKLGKWRNGTPSEATRVSLMAALASAPSTPPHAVVEAVPLTDEQADALRRLWPAIEKAMGCLVFTAEQAGAVQADMNTVRRGIAPKAAPEQGEQ